MTEKLRVGVIGAGLKGTQHARAYQLDPRTEVVAVAEKDPKVLELFQKRFGLERGYADYREMLANEEIDISAPILPSTVIPEVVLASVEAEVKGIFCEKPFCVTLEEADRLVETCDSKGVHFASGDAERNSDNLWKARGIIESGEIGDVQAISIYGGTGEMWGGGCQSLSVMRMFAWDADVEWVTGWVENDAWSDNDQGMGGSIHFANGIECYIYMRSGAKRGFEVLCEGGYLSYDWGEVRMFRSYGSEAEEFGGPFPLSKHFGPDLDSDGWISMATRQDNSTRSFLDTMEAAVEPRCSGENMRKVLEIIVGMRESHRHSFAPIKFPIEDRGLGVLPVPARAFGQRSVTANTEWYWPALMSQKPE